MLKINLRTSEHFENFIRNFLNKIFYTLD